ncbi:MAG: hypothetical protein EOP09_20670, partial [Proteobacteria bacterium]
MLFFRTSVLSVLITFAALTSKAAPLPELLEALRDSGVNYEIVGTVCEQVAVLQMAEEYPAPQFEVLSGVTYVDDIVNGELDVIVMDRRANRA